MNVQTVINIIKFIAGVAMWANITSALLEKDQAKKSNHLLWAILLFLMT